MKVRNTFILIRRTTWWMALVFVVMATGFSLQTPVCAENTVQRPIEDFVEAQGIPAGYSPYDYVGWLSAADDPPILLGMVDYAGVTNHVLALNLGTEFSGTVTERPLPDGRAEVLVILRTKKALTWVADLGETFEYPDEFNCTDCPLVFGVRPPDATPVLGESKLQLMFINTAPGAPLPDLLSAFVLGDTYVEGQELISVSFHAKAFGFDSDGKPAKVIMDQIGRFKPSGKGVVSKSGFLVERIEVKPVGQGEVVK